MAELVKFRDTIKRICPPWLRRGLAEKILYAIAIQLDALTDAVVSAVRRRFPIEDESADALPLIGRERRIIRGRNEPNGTYAVRLRRWLDDHATRGGPYALLEQLRAFWASAPFQIDLYYAGVNRTGFVMDAAGTITRFYNMSWTATDYATRWARWLLVYHWPVELPPKDQWGDVGLVWGAGKVWGSGLDAETVADIRRVPRQWGNAHSRGHVHLVDPSSDVSPISLAE